LQGLPYTYVLVAEADPIRDDGPAYQARLRAAGVSCDLLEATGMIHAFMHFCGIAPEAEQYMRAMGDVLKARL
jgi:acetyl esterase